MRFSGSRRSVSSVVLCRCGTSVQLARHFRPEHAMIHTTQVGTAVLVPDGSLSSDAENFSESARDGSLYE